MSDKQLLKQIVASMKSVAKELGIEPYELSKAAFLKFTQDEAISEWSLRKFGGFAGLLKANFPFPDKALAETKSLSDLAKYVNKLEKQLAEKQTSEEHFIKAINDNIKPINFKQPKFKPTKKGSLHRELVVMLNDLHLGLIVDSASVNNLNSFSWKEASRRIALVIKETLEYKLHTRNEVKKLHLVLNGDLIAGLIHGLMTKGQELSIHQFSGALHILTHVIAILSSEFVEVEVHAIGGNHSELPHKREHGKRVTSEHYDSYANYLFYALSVAFRKTKNVSFNIPKTPYLFIDLPAGRAMINHGHALFSRALGNPGSSINVKSLSVEIQKFNMGEINRGKEPVKLVLFGHTHSFAHFMTNDGVEVYAAPSLSGIDEYAHGLTINTNLIGQVVFESTPEFILGDSRLIRLKDADNDKELDKLIPIYNNELKFKK